MKNKTLILLFFAIILALASCEEEGTVVFTTAESCKFNYPDTIISAEPHVFYLELSSIEDGTPVNWDWEEYSEWNPTIGESNHSTYHDGDTFGPSNPPSSWNEGVLPAWVKIEEGLIEGRDFLKVSIDRNSDNALRGICIVCASNNNADYTSGRINIFQKPMPDQALFRHSDTQFLQ